MKPFETAAILIAYLNYRFVTICSSASWRCRAVLGTCAQAVALPLGLMVRLRSFAPGTHPMLVRGRPAWPRLDPPKPSPCAAARCRTCC
jgi:hypothetical protein